MYDSILYYDLGEGVECFSTRRDSVLPYPVIQSHQTHTIEVAVIDRPDYTREQLEGIDAMVTNLKGVAIGVRTADCIPILIYDPVKKAAGAAHSGWRGTLGKISFQTVRTMCLKYGCNVSDMRAVIGPGIGVDAFQVGEDIAEHFKEAGFPMEKIWSFRGPKIDGDLSGGHHINLPEAVHLTLLEAGLKEENISMCGICTYTDSSFFSARREGYQCGRTINAIKIL